MEDIKSFLGGIEEFKALDDGRLFRKSILVNKFSLQLSGPLRYSARYQWVIRIPGENLSKLTKGDLTAMARLGKSVMYRISDSARKK